MKLSLTPLLILLFLAIRSFAQETEEIVEKTGNKWSNDKKVYYVLKNNPAIKHGSYQHYHNDKLLVSGFYKMGIKDSTWQRNNNRGIALSKKTYSENKRNGIWEFFNNDGKPVLQYDFNKNAILIQQPDSVFGYSYQSSNGEWINSKADRDPIWLRSINEWQAFMNLTLRYPQEAIDKWKMGVVIVEVLVNEEGNSMEYLVENSVFPALDKEAIRVISLDQPEFLPAEKDGKKVKTKIKIPVVFRLERG